MIPGFGILRRLVFLAVLLTVAVVGGSLYLEGQAERRLGAVVQERFDLSSEPTVDIGGGLLLVNVFKRTLPSLSVTAQKTKVGKVPLRELTVTLEDLSLDGSLLDPRTLTLSVAEGTVRATVTEGAVNDLLERAGEDATIALSPDRVRVRATRVIGGKQRKLVATGTLKVKGNMLRFTPSSVTVDGETPPAALQRRAKDETTVAVKFPKLPGGYRVDSIDVLTDAIRLTARLDGEKISLAG